MKPALRIATAEAATSIEMPDAIMALAREIIAARPVSVFMAYEVAASGDDMSIVIRTIPNSALLRKGYIDTAYRNERPEEFESGA